jgi:hypothetical protein
VGNAYVSHATILFRIMILPIAMPSSSETYQLSEGHIAYFFWAEQ